MPVRVAEQRIELRPEHVAVAERRVDEVTRNGEQGDRSADRVERRDHHRVGQGRVAIRHGVDAHQQDVDPLAVAGQRASTDAGRPPLEAVAAEDLRERLAKDRAVPKDDEVWDGDEDEDQTDARRCPRRPMGPWRRVSRNAWPTASSRHARTSRLSVRRAPRISGATIHATRRAGRLDLQQEDDQQHAARATGGRRAAASCVVD